LLPDAENIDAHQEHGSGMTNCAGSKIAKENTLGLMSLNIVGIIKE